VKLRPVSISDDRSSDLSSSDSSSYTELTTLLSNNSVDNEVVIDWIDVSQSRVLHTLLMFVCL